MRSKISSNTRLRSFLVYVYCNHACLTHTHHALSSPPPPFPSDPTTLLAKLDAAGGAGSYAKVNTVKATTPLVAEVKAGLNGGGARAPGHTAALLAGLAASALLFA